MKHLIVCREFPPAPSGGIGTYVLHISKLLAERGETVHLIGQLWAGAEKRVEESCRGRLIIHRIPLEDWTCYPIREPSPAIDCREARDLFDSDFYPQSFSWQAGLLAEGGHGVVAVGDRVGIQFLGGGKDSKARTLYFEDVTSEVEKGPYCNGMEFTDQGLELYMLLLEDFVVARGISQFMVKLPESVV